MTRTGGAVDAAAWLRHVGITVLERGWLSSNTVVCHASSRGGVHAVVDTGYSAHASLGLQLIKQALGPDALDLIVNTHLHSDHCGGNAMLQRRYPKAQTWVPKAVFDIARRWDETSLTFERLGQRCDRFDVHHALVPGETLTLGEHVWHIHEAPGHDPTAVMLFEPTNRVLISGDALWERRLAIVFPELQGENGFDANVEALDDIEALNPSVVIPGHGRPFTNVVEALQASRERLAHYRRHPVDHARHARKALLMFHMLEHHRRSEADILRWLQDVDVLQACALEPPREARDTIESLVKAGVLRREHDVLCLARP